LNTTEATAIAGSLSKPSKMPGYGYGLPAGMACPVGSKLMNVKGSVCNKCYALKGHYGYPNVKSAQAFRLSTIINPQWADAMVVLINDAIDPMVPYFRWHDSGDLQGMDHLLKIVEVARRTKAVKHWLPTREAKLVADYYKEYGALHPTNLVIRVSATMVDGGASKVAANTSTVVSDKSMATCRAFENGNKCGSCRKCWDANERNVSYAKH